MQNPIFRAIRIATQAEPGIYSDYCEAIQVLIDNDLIHRLSDENLEFEARRLIDLGHCHN